MKTNTSRILFTAAALAATTLTAQAGALAFDFKDPKGVNNVQFHLDAPLESISGSANGVSGTIHFDPARPEATKGRIVLATNTLTVGNPLMREHLHGANWLDVATHPEITFEALKVANARISGNRVDADVTGRLTVKGVTREITVPVSFTHLPDMLGVRNNNPDLKGDLLVVRSTFSINRSDFGIRAGQATDRVAESIQLTLSVAGGATKG
jgi:polyisoprenoid-binding protein YceI